MDNYSEPISRTDTERFIQMSQCIEQMQLKILTKIEKNSPTTYTWKSSHIIWIKLNQFLFKV